MKLQELVASLTLILAFSVSAQEAKPEIKVHAGVETQMQKDLFDNGEQNNVDQFFGRFNFGASTQGTNISGRVNVRAFIEGNNAKYTIEAAWMNYKIDSLSIKFGRWFTTESKTLQFGNYLVQDLGGGFMSKLYGQNALELMYHHGEFKTAFTLNSNDPNLNAGNMQIMQKYMVPKKYTLGVGYANNFLDKTQSNTANLEHRFSFLADANLRGGFKPYLEIARIENLDSNRWDTPVHVGINFPTAGWLDDFALEMEYVKDRAVETQVGLYTRKKWNNHAQLIFSVHNSRSKKSFQDLSWGMRFSGSM
jgi:hypothetical protein